MKKNHLVISAALCLIAAFASAAYLYQTQKDETQTQRASTHSDALVPAYAVRKGNPEAKVTIVEFLDPACGTCKQFHPVIKDLLKQFPDKIQVVVRYSPFHPGSDQMVAILEAVRKEGQFWNVLDIMFETQEAWAINHQAKPELFWGYLTGYGFDVAKIQADMKDPEIARRIKQDLADGELLGATKTPTFFVNGKPLSSFGYKQLISLVESELTANY